MRNEKRKNRMRKPVAAVLSVIMALFCTAQAALAADPEASSGYTSAVGFGNWVGATVYSVGSGKEITDFFGEATKNLVPGDAASITVKLTNNDSAGQVTFALYARALRGEEAAALTAEGGAFADKTADDDLLDHIRLTITNFDGNELYSGPMGGDTATDSIYGSFTDSGGSTVSGKILGAVSAGDSGVLTISVSVDGAVGNKFQNALAAVEWGFLAEPYVPPAPSDPPPSDPPIVTPGIPGTPANPVQPAAPAEEPPVEIEDGGPPLGDAEPAPETETIPDTAPPLIDIPIDIPDEDVPLAEFEVTPPKTGDEGSVFTWAALCAATAAVLAVWLVASIVRKKRKARS